LEATTAIFWEAIFCLKTTKIAGNYNHFLGTTAEVQFFGENYSRLVGATAIL
jgi:hypothetical protein